MIRSRIANSLTGWLARWRPVLPLFLGETIVWTGFGALLPVLPLFYTEQGVDLATLGLVVAAWPAARLVGEPVFGWIADRTPRVPLMVGSLLATGVFVALPLAVHGSVEFLVLRALAGLATAAYDPAARGLLKDATPAERQGEAFGLYGSTQMAGLLLGPAIGGLGAAAFGSIGFVFVFGGIAAGLAAVAVAAGVRETPRRGQAATYPATGLADFRRDVLRLHPAGKSEPQADDVAGPAPGGSSEPVVVAQGPPGLPTRLANRLLIAALIANVGGYFGGGTYEVVWSLFLTSKGAGIGFIGLTFMMFSVPIVIAGLWVGRLVDRHGSLVFLVAGSIGVAAAAPTYTLIEDPIWVLPLLVVEAFGFAFINPALYAIVSRASPPGRSSTAQGLFGAAGTLGFVVASVITGALAVVDIRWPFYVLSAVVLGSLALALVIGGREIVAAAPGRATTIGPAEPIRST
jgi:MFS family permease